MNVRMSGYAGGGRSCAAPADVPSCASGPVGRAGFVARELRDLWRELRDAVRSRRDRSVAPLPGAQTTADCVWRGER